MTIANEHVIIALIVSAMVALGIVVLAIWTAPSFEVGVNRIRLVLKVAGTTVSILAAMAGIGMLVWGLVSRSEGLMYFSMMPLVLAMLTSNYMRRSGIS